MTEKTLTMHLNIEERQNRKYMYSGDVQRLISFKLGQSFSLPYETWVDYVTATEFWDYTVEELDEVFENVTDVIIMDEDAYKILKKTTRNEVMGWNNIKQCYLWIVTDDKIELAE